VPTQVRKSVKIEVMCYYSNGMCIVVRPFRALMVLISRQEGYRPSLWKTCSTPVPVGSSLDTHNKLDLLHCLGQLNSINLIELSTAWMLTNPTHSLRHYMIAILCSFLMLCRFAALCRPRLVKQKLNA